MRVTIRLQIGVEKLLTFLSTILGFGQEILVEEKDEDEIVQNHMFKASKCPKKTSFWLTRFGSSISIKRHHFIFLPLGLEVRESIKMKVDIFK